MHVVVEHSCGECKKKFKNAAGLQQHRSRAARGLLKSCMPLARMVSNVCQSCQKQFKNEGGLRTHLARVKAGTIERCNGQPRSDTNTYSADCQSTPQWMWEELATAIPSLTKTEVWDPFFNEGASKTRMKNAGFEIVRHTKVDFFRNHGRWPKAVIVSNPPFSIKARILGLLISIDRPFVLLLPIRTIFAKYYRPWKKLIKLVVPTKALIDNGKTTECVFMCYKCGPHDLLEYCQ